MSIALLAAWPILAIAEPTSAPVDPELAHRVAGERWTEADATFRDLLARRVPLSPEDWLAGGVAAWALGHITHAHDRFVEANADGAIPEATDHLLAIAEGYGWVRLLCDDPMGVGLVPLDGSTDPQVQRSQSFATARVAEDCGFDGLLPVGAYAFVSEIVTVKARRDTVHIDLRGQAPEGAERRRIRKHRRFSE